MHAVYLCHFCPFSPSIDREPQKSFYVFLPSIVSPCSLDPLQSCTWARTLKSLYLLRVPMQSHYVQKSEIVFVCSLRPLWSCYASRAFAVFVYSATSKSLYTSRATLYSLYLLRAPMQSLYNQKRKSLCLSFATLAVPYYLAHLCSLRLLLNLKSLHHVTQPYAVSIVPESLCSLRMNKSGKVFAYTFAFAVFIVTKYLCSLHTLRPP